MACPRVARRPFTVCATLALIGCGGGGATEPTHPWFEQREVALGWDAGLCTAPPSNLLGPDQAQGDILAADIDRDGHLDFALLRPLCGQYDSSPTVARIFQGASDFTFTAMLHSIGSGQSRTPLLGALADFEEEGSGFPDLVATLYVDATSLSSGRIEAFGYRGVDWCLSDWKSLFDIETSQGNLLATRLVSGDFDEDDHEDVATFAPLVVDVGLLELHLGNGDGTFGGLAPNPFDFLLPAPESPVVADVDGDGHLDLAYVSGPTSSVVLMRGHGTGAFTAEPPVVLPFEPRRLVAGDFNGDGRIDLVAGGSKPPRAASGDRHKLAVLLRGPAAYTLGDVVALADDQFPQELGAADFGGYHHVDVVVGTAYQLSCFEGDGNGGLTALAGHAARFPLPGYVWRIVPADIDGKGRTDLLVGTDSNYNSPLQLADVTVVKSRQP